MDLVILGRSKTFGMSNEIPTLFLEMKFSNKFKDFAVKEFNKLFKILMNSLMIESNKKFKIQVQCQMKLYKKEVECSGILDF